MTLSMQEAIRQNTVGNSEGQPLGVPTSYSWYSGVLLTGNNAPPSDFSAVSGWGQVYQDSTEPTYTNPNARVEVANAETYVHLRSTGEWQLVQDQANNPIAGGHFVPDFAGNAGQPMNVATGADGTASFGAPTASYNDHFWSGSRGTYEPGDVDGVYTQMDMRVTDPNLNVVANVGADWWRDASAPYVDGFGNNPGAGMSNWVDLSTEWKTLAFYSSPEIVEADPPPPLAGSTGDDTFGEDNSASDDEVNSANVEEGNSASPVSTGDGSNSIVGGEGNEQLLGGEAGNDTIFGGAGATDTLSGGDGADQTAVDTGEDQLAGSPGNDTIFGGAGATDALSGGDGADQTAGGTGEDQLTGTAGNDTIFGGAAAADTLNGGDGADQTAVGTGEDQLTGTAGNDTIFAGDGSNTLFGGGGDDTFEINNNSGDSTIVGGNGHNTVNFNDRASTDVDSTDTVAGTTIIAFTDGQTTTISDVQDLVFTDGTQHLP